MTRKLFWMIFVAPVAGATAFSAGAEETQNTAAAQPGIQMSEWGRETRLPELALPARFGAQNSETGIPGFGDFLAEEARTLGAGALDSGQLRGMMANRLIGREDDSAMHWLSSRWKTAPNRLADFLADSAELRLESSPWVESADLEWNPTEDNWSAFSASGVGVLHRWENAALGILPNIERTPEGDKTQGSFGVFHRRAFGQWGVAGVNLFADYADNRDSGEFARWSLGADFQSAWADVFVNRYFGKDSARRLIAASGRQAHYAPDGLDAEFRLHAPRQKWIDGFARFSEWEGRFGQRDDSEFTYGMALTPIYGPLAGLRAEMSTGDETKFQIQYGRIIGAENSLTRAAPFAPERALLAPAVRENDILIRSANLPDAEPPALLPPSESRQFITDDSVPSYLRDAYEQCQWAGDISDWVSNTPSAELQAITDYQWGISVTTAAGDDDNFDDLCQALRFQGNPNHRGNHGDTPLHLAAKAGALKNVKLLILAGADPFLLNIDSKNALEVASDTFEPLLSSGEDAGICVSAPLSSAKGKLCEIGRILRAQGAECHSFGNALCDVDFGEYRPVDHLNFEKAGRHVLAGGILTVTMLAETQRYAADDNYLNADSPFYSGINSPVVALLNLVNASQFTQHGGINLTLQFADSDDSYSGGVRIKYLGFDNPPYVRVHEDGFVIPYTFGEQQREHGEITPIAGMGVITLTGAIQYSSIAENPQTVFQAATILVTVQDPDIIPVDYPAVNDAYRGALFQTEVRLSAGNVRFEIEQAGSDFALATSGKRVGINILNPLAVGEYAATLRAHFLRDGIALNTSEFAFSITVSPYVPPSVEDEDWSAPSIPYAAPGYSGVLFSITATTPVSGVHYALSVSGWSAAISVVRGSVGIISVSDFPAGTLTGQVRATLVNNGLSHSVLAADFAVTVLPPIAPLHYEAHPDLSGVLGTLNIDNRLDSVNVLNAVPGVIHDISVDRNGRISLPTALSIGVYATLVANITAPNLLGTLRAFVSALGKCVVIDNREALRAGMFASALRQLDYNLFIKTDSKYDSDEAMCRFLRQGADPDYVSGGRTPLINAASNDLTVKVSILLDFGGNPNKVGGSANLAPLHYAATGDSYESARLLLARGGNAALEDSTGQAPLHKLAAILRTSHQTDDFARALIGNSRSVVNLKDDNGQTPLYLASRSDNLAVAGALLDNNANPNLSEEQYCYSPLHIVRSVDMARRLLADSRTEVNQTVRRATTRYRHNAPANGSTPLDTLYHSQAAITTLLINNQGCYRTTANATPQCAGGAGTFLNLDPDCQGS